MNEEKFCNIKQNKELNAIVHTLPSKQKLEKFYAGKIHITPSSNTDVKIIVKVPESGPRAVLRTSTHKLLDVLLNQCTKTDSRKLQFSIRDYANLMGISDYYNARKQLVYDMKALFALAMEIKDKNSNFIILRFMERYGLHGGAVCAELTPSFIELLKSCTVAPLPVGIFRINSHKNPHSYYFGRKLSELIYMQKGNFCKIKIENLIKSSPLMPSEEELQTSGNRNYVQRIMTPFIRDMGALPKEIEYKYIYNNDNISREELQGMTYKRFKTVTVQASLNID